MKDLEEAKETVGIQISYDIRAKKLSMLQEMYSKMFLGTSAKQSEKYWFSNWIILQEEFIEVFPLWIDRTTKMKPIFRSPVFGV